MSKQRLYEIRTNTNMAVDYENNKLVPQVELIIIAVHPQYQVTTKGKEQYIKKGHGLKDMRITTSLNGLNELIVQLQATAAHLQQFEQLANGLNMVIDRAKVKKEKQ